MTTFNVEWWDQSKDKFVHDNFRTTRDLFVTISKNNEKRGLLPEGNELLKYRDSELVKMNTVSLASKEAPPEMVPVDPPLNLPTNKNHGLLPLLGIFNKSHDQKVQQNLESQKANKQPPSPPNKNNPRR